jgi:hypothetical protein
MGERSMQWTLKAICGSYFLWNAIVS